MVIVRWQKRIRDFLEAIQMAGHDCHKKPTQAAVLVGRDGAIGPPLFISPSSQLSPHNNAVNQHGDATTNIAVDTNGEVPREVSYLKLFSTLKMGICGMNWLINAH